MPLKSGSHKHIQRKRSRQRQNRYGERCCGRILWHKSGSSEQHQVVERLEAGSQKAVLPWQLWCLVDNSWAPHHQRPTYTHTHSHTACVSECVCVCSVYISIETRYYYTNLNNNSPSMFLCAQKAALILLRCLSLYQHGHSEHTGPCRFLLFISLLLFSFFPETPQSLPHQKASILRYRTGSISDPADQPSVRPSEHFGIWSIWPQRAQNVAAVVFYIDWNNRSALGSEWTDHWGSYLHILLPFTSFN